MKRRRFDIENSENLLVNLKENYTNIKIFKEKFQTLVLDYTSIQWNCSRLEEFRNKIFAIEEELENLKIYQKFSNETIFLCEMNNEANRLCQKITSKIGAITQNLLDIKNKFDFDSKCIYGFKYIPPQKNLRLNIYDIKTQTSMEKEFGPDYHFSLDSSIVQLPNFEIFCCYSGGRAHNGLCCIIDMKSLTIKRSLPPSPYFWNSTCIYYENSIYMFGGYNYADNIPIAFKFDFLQNKWFKIPPTSITITHCSMEIFKNSIIISGRHVSTIFKYDLQIESNSDLFLEGLSLETYKAIFSGDSKLYIFENSNCIFESEVDNDYAWKNIGKFDYQFSMVGFKKFNNGSIIISLLNKAKLGFYKFDLKYKNFKRLKDIKGK